MISKNKIFPKECYLVIKIIPLKIKHYQYYRENLLNYQGAHFLNTLSEKTE